MKLALANVLSVCLALSCPLGASAAEKASAVPAQKPKNWTAPATKIYAQALSDEIMAKHPELISVTFHGVPPGLDKVYTMFAGSFPERIGTGKHRVNLVETGGYAVKRDANQFGVLGHDLVR